ncbi:MAG TPA: zinc ribbon domain-containing protein [Thermoanaerobaculia bacterium]|jgi:hypothetical protein|nr:zinc ribbon domain-containing protein [Thermoanaerobaculia bacterium]
MEIGILAWLLFGIVSAIIAKKKGRSGCAWFFLGVLLGPFGLILAFAASSEREPATPPSRSRSPRTCPSCGEPISREAAACPACEEKASRTRTASPGPTVDYWTCPRCGSSNSKKLSRCGNCGYSDE